MVEFQYYDGLVKGQKKYRAQVGSGLGSGVPCRHVLQGSWLMPVFFAPLGPLTIK